MTIPEFDLTAAVVFTSDTPRTGCSRPGNKTRASRSQCPVGERYRGGTIPQGGQSYTRNRRESIAPKRGRGPAAVREAERATFMRGKACPAGEQRRKRLLGGHLRLRPLRMLMRGPLGTSHSWLDSPMSTPYRRQLLHAPAALRVGGHAAKEFARRQRVEHRKLRRRQTATGRGVEVTSLPGWTVQEIAIDDVVMNARIVPAKEAVDPEPAINAKPTVYSPTSPEKRVIDPLPPRPKLGQMSHA